MNKLEFNRANLPIVTGKPMTSPMQTRQGETNIFETVLQEKISQSSLQFSKHAANRVIERNIDMSPQNITRLNEGVRIAEQKGLDDTLILIDRTAFIVSVRNNKVITTISGDDLKGNVFTNIDGTVIV